MVRRWLTILNREISGVHHAAYLLGGFALLSQILALFRDRLLAAHIGPGVYLDIYYAAFRVPDFIYASVASLVSVSVLIPFLSEREGKPEEEKSFMDSIFTCFFLVMIIVSAITFFLMPYLAKFFLQNTSVEVTASIVMLARILLLQPIFLGISNLFGSITQSRNRFFLYAVSPLLYNAAIIFGIVFLVPYMGIAGVVVGVVIGAFLHFLIQLPFVSSEGMLPRFIFKPDWKLFRTVIRVSLPRTLALAATTVELIFITFYASSMVNGSISIFNLSLNLQSVPLAIIGVSYSLAAFPTLSRLFSQGEREKFIEHMVVPARHIIFWSLPISVLFITLRAQIVRTILGSGNFNWEDTRLTAAALALFVFSLVAQSLEQLFIRGYYATGNTRKPVVINLFSSIVTIGAPFILIKCFYWYPVFSSFIEHLLKVEGISGTVVLMLPLGFSIGTIVNTAIFWFMFETDFPNSTKALWRTMFNGFAAAIITGFIAKLGLGYFDPVFGHTGVFGVFAQGFVSGMLGIVAGIGILKLLKSKELEDVSHVLTSKIFRQKTVILDQERVD